MTLRITILALLSLHIYLSGFSQQTFQFSQYMFNGLVINPAYAGADEALSLTFYNRSQWKGLEGSPTTQTLSAHTYLPRQRVGGGMTIINDKIGVHQSLILSLAAAYHLPVSGKSVLSFGMQGGYAHRESDYQSLDLSSGNDPKMASAGLALNMLDIGAGVYFRSPRIHLGLSAPHLLPGRVNLNDTISVKFNRRQIFLFSKLRLEASPSIVVEPGFLLKYFPGLPLSFDVNTNVVFHKVLITGVSYRKKESVDFLLRAQVTPQLQLGYGYDHVIGRASSLSRASHEVMVNYLFRYARSNAAAPR